MPANISFAVKFSLVITGRFAEDELESSENVDHPTRPFIHQPGVSLVTTRGTVNLCNT